MSITQRGQLTKDDSGVAAGWSYFYTAGTGATIVKATPAIFHSITFNKPVATTVVSLYDAAAAGTGTFGVITIPSSPQPVTLFYDTSLSNGLSVNIATAASDITISYI